ncbi:MAG: hypothetical protein IMY71_13155 [Bacteroidetes bacterium]|nr:hypothetical protein [Bacteroidota bacterium]
MRKIYNTTAIPVLLVSIILCSCSSKNLLTISVTEPAPVYIPSNIKTIGIVDRSLPLGENEKMDKLDKILSAEGKNLDKDGAHESVTGLFDELINSNKFSEVKIIDSVDVRSPGLGVFPSALSWKTTERICYENNVDAIFVLSFYDTDAKIDYKTVPIEIDGPLGIKIPAIEHHATIATLIKTGWRIYDPVNKFILDEYLVNENLVLTGAGINPVRAIEAIMGRKEAVLQVSNNIGHNYALRILPYRIRVSRHYYVRGTNNFKIAKRRARTGNWDGAAELWDKEVSNTKIKVAGRACYNMAIINEINGDLNAAIEWTSKSYTDYKNKMALRYLNMLKYRIERNKQLQQQME